jgi:hypothetical protein
MLLLWSFQLGSITCDIPSPPLAIVHNEPCVSQHHLITMSAWGSNGSARSCEALLKRVEANDPTLTELVILPLKQFGSQDLRRLARALFHNTHLTSLKASGHGIEDVDALEELGKAMATATSSALIDLAIGDSNMGDEAVAALCRGLGSNNNNKLTLKKLDLSWKCL